jgi:AraC-like DNA-binding protein
MHKVAYILINPKTRDNAEAWIHESKVCRHFILSTISHELFMYITATKKRMRYDTISHELFDETYIKEVRRSKKQREKNFI